LFKFQGAVTPVEFVYLGSIGLFRILGFNAGANVSGVSIVPPNPLNLLGIQKLNISSQNLATISSFSSRRNLGNQIIQTIPVNVPSWNLINYENKNNIHGRMKSRYLNNIDIQVTDEFGRYVEFNNIDWNITIQIIIFRTHEISFKSIDFQKGLAFSQTPQIKEDKKSSEKSPEKPQKKPNKNLDELKLLERK
jgi:hypothetical protein